MSDDDNVKATTSQSNEIPGTPETKETTHSLPTTQSELQEKYSSKGDVVEY